MLHDAVIVGGGPAGLSAALALGRARKRVLLCDSGPRRNATAVEVHTFVTRDGIPPAEFRRVAREQLAAYPGVTVLDQPVEAIAGARGAFEVTVGGAIVLARRIIVCTGMMDELPEGEISGFRALWGRSIFQCPYCHGWEVQGQRWGYLARESAVASFPFMLKGWSRDVVVFTNAAFTVPAETRDRFTIAGIRLETGRVTGLVAREGLLEAVQMADGTTVPCQVLFAQPPQRQVELVRRLGLALDEHGFVKVDPTTRETSVPGIYAAGDLSERMQWAIMAAAAGAQAGAMLNHELTNELAVAGAL